MKNLPLYKRYAETEPCGFYCMCNWGGLEILDIDACEGEYGVAVAQDVKRFAVIRFK